MKFAEAEIGAELAGVPAESRRRVLMEYLVEAHLMAAAAEKDKLADGAAFEQRMKYYRLRAMRDSYFEQKIRDAVPEAEAKALYDERVKSLPQQQEVRARHILVKTEDEAKTVAEELKKGGDFAELAKKYSQDRGGAAGGDLGYFTRGQMVPAFEEAAFKLEKDKISDPVQTEFGWHILKVEDKRDRQPPSFEEVKDQITASLIQAKLQAAVQDLRDNGKIEILDAELKKEVEAEAAEKAKTEEPKDGEKKQ
ncbi:MAG: peptidylprolyl isomerase [Rhodomicrobium sp.]|nr:peptidylprolyl isomerase [Rhodomicrobium sp.]